MTENTLITLYCIVDEFIHRFLETSAGRIASTLFRISTFESYLSS